MEEIEEKERLKLLEKIRGKKIVSEEEEKKILQKISIETLVEARKEGGWTAEAGIEFLKEAIREKLKKADEETLKKYIRIRDDIGDIAIGVSIGKDKGSIIRKLLGL